MEDKCPKCGETLITRTINKKMGLGSIDYPIARICPKCNWNEDLTGAGDIESKPVFENMDEAKKEEKKFEIKPTGPLASTLPSSKHAPTFPIGINSLISIVLAILVIGTVAWVFNTDSPDEEQVVNTPDAAPAPIITQTPVLTPTSAVVPEVTASGKRISLKLEVQRGITPATATIKPGDEVVWTNDGTYAVTLVSSDGLFEDRFLNNAKRTSHIFKKPGTFTFYLKEDVGLTGTIIVQP